MKSIGALAIVLATTAVAGADVTPEDVAKARALFLEGQAINDTNPTDEVQIDAACAKFEASLQIDPQIGTMLNLGICRERQGRPLEAYALFEAAAENAARTGKQGREQFARGRLVALAPKLGRVTLHVAQPEPAGLTIKLGARTLTSADRAKSQVVAPGVVVIDVAAPDREPLHLQRTAPAGVETVIEIPVLAAQPATQPGGTTATTHRRWTPILVTAGGGVLVLASLGIGLHAKSRYDDGKDADDMAAVTSAQHEADVATVVGIVGIVTVAVGAVLYVRGRRADQNRVVVGPTTVGSHGGIAVWGSF